MTSNEEASERPTSPDGPTGSDSDTEVTERPVCGLVMPISAINGCDASHWEDVKEILEQESRRLDSRAGS